MNKLKYKFYNWLFEYLETNYYPPKIETWGKYTSKTMNPKLWKIRLKLDKAYWKIVDDNFNQFEKLYRSHPNGIPSMDRFKVDVKPFTSTEKYLHNLKK